MVRSRTPAPIGERYGYLTVLGEGAPQYSKRNATGRHKAGIRTERTWVVECDCGNEATILAGNVRNGRTLTCGSHRHGKRLSPHVPLTYGSVHIRLKRERGRAAEYTCIECGGQASSWAYRNFCDEEVEAWVPYDNRVMRYCEHQEHYDPMCGTCHQKKDLAEKKRRDSE